MVSHVRTSMIGPAASLFAFLIAWTCQADDWLTGLLDQALAANLNKAWSKMELEHMFS